MKVDLVLLIRLIAPTLLLLLLLLGIRGAHTLLFLALFFLFLPGLLIHSVGIHVGAARTTIKVHGLAKFLLRVGAHLLGLRTWRHRLWLQLRARPVHLSWVLRLLHQVLSPLLLLLVVVLIARVRWLHLLLLLLVVLGHVHHLVAIRLHLWRLRNGHIICHGVG